MRMCMICRKNCSLVYHITQSYCISSGKEGFASRQHRCTSLLHLLCLIERNEWALFYPVEIVCDWTWWSTQAHWKHNGILEEEIQKVVAIYTWMKRWYPSVCAGSAGFGWSSKSWMPTRICFTVMAGLQPYIYPQGFPCYPRASPLWLGFNPMYNTIFKLLRAADGTYTILIKNRKTDSSGRVDIRVEETLREFTFRGLARVVFTEVER